MAKRKHARVAVQRSVEYRHAQGQGDGMLMNLSLHGCGINGAPPFSGGTRLRLRLWLPDQALPVTVEQAIVRWVKDDSFGVSFLKVHPDAQARLAQVFQLLHEAQQPEVKVIPRSALAHYDGAPSVEGNAPDWSRPT